MADWDGSHWNRVRNVDDLNNRDTKDTKEEIQEEENDFFRLAEEASAAREEKERKKQEKAEARAKRKEARAARKKKGKTDEPVSGNGENVPDEADEDTEDDEKAAPEEQAPKEVNIVKDLLNLIIYIGVVILLCFLIITFVGQRTTVHGSSMESTLHDGDNLWINKLSYRFEDPKRFDIVVFPFQDQDVYYIKRIIGLPGEKVQILPDGTILINDKPLQESYGREIIADPGIAAEPIYLASDEYFVLGDNRNDSHDSRWADVGNVKRSRLIGKAVLRLSPIRQFGKIR